MNLRRCSSLYALLAALALPLPALGYDVPPGEACDFGINVDVAPGHGANFRLFTDKNGDFVRVLITGTLPTLTFSSPDNGTSYTVVSKGTHQQYKANGDGTTTFSGAGHNVISYFSTDEPASETILYIGHIEILIDENGIFHLVKATGKQIDICALLE